MEFTILLLRRIGLAVGVLIFMYAVTYLIRRFNYNISDLDRVSWKAGMTWGAAIVAFLLPRIEASEKACFAAIVAFFKYSLDATAPESKEQK